MAGVPSKGKADGEGGELRSRRGWNPLGTVSTVTATRTNRPLGMGPNVNGSGFSYEDGIGKEAHCVREVVREMA